MEYYVRRFHGGPRASVGDGRSSSEHGLRRLILGLSLACHGGWIYARRRGNGRWSVPAEIVYYPANAGYGVYSTTTPPTSVSTQLQVPKAKCTTSKAAVSFGALATRLQDGVAGDAAVVLTCNGGKAKYSAGILLHQRWIHHPFHHGPPRAISLPLRRTERPPRGGSVTFTDSTTGFTQTSTGPGTSSAFAFVGTFPVSSSYKKVAKFSRF